MTLLLPMAYSLPTAEHRKMLIKKSSSPRILALLSSLLALALGARTQAGTQAIRVRAAGFVLGASHTVATTTNQLAFALTAPGVSALPFNQSAVKQGTAPALLGPDAKTPYFTVRFALPVPPENATNLDGALTGLDTNVFTHNHSPGFEILPNGDALAVYFSTPPGLAEADISTSFVQARLRYGAEDWDLPELFFKTEGYNDQSGLLWNDRGTIRFFGGGRGLSDFVPFKQATSTNNGATWTLSLPQLDKPAEHYTAQPITSAFRSRGVAAGILPAVEPGFQPGGKTVDSPARVANLPAANHSNASPGGKMPPSTSGEDARRYIYFAMDGVEASSFLWRSTDDGVHWHDLGGRTGARHSVIVPLNDKGTLLSIGGKNASTNGWSPQNISTNYGASWGESFPSAFPPLGTAQRPSLIRLASGNLLYVGESYLHKADRPAPKDWKFGDNCFVALSTNNGASWHIKPLPVQLPGHQRTNHPTLGYVTARQGANGVIHILTTVTQPCLHYELNEAWIFSDAGDLAPETSGGVVRKFSENFPAGPLRIMWSARICPNGRYLLEGTQTTFYENGHRQHEVAYVAGRKTGPEMFWSPTGAKVWSWNHDLQNHTSVWTHYWPNGGKRIESTWNTKPEARDLPRSFFGLVVDGLVRQWNEDGSLKFSGHFVNGVLAGERGVHAASTDKPQDASALSNVPEQGTSKRAEARAPVPAGKN